MDETKDQIGRVTILLNLYLPYLNQQTNDYLKSLSQLRDAHDTYVQLSHNLEWIDLRDEYVRVKKLEEIYFQKSLPLQHALEKLVK